MVSRAADDTQSILMKQQIKPKDYSPISRLKRKAKIKIGISTPEEREAEIRELRTARESKESKAKQFREILKERERISKAQADIRRARQGRFPNILQFNQPQQLQRQQQRVIRTRQR